MNQLSNQYKISLKYCIDLIKSNKDRHEIQKILNFVFKFEYNFPVFCQFFLPQAFNKPFCKEHLEIIHEFTNEHNSAVAFPRGHGKSTLIGQGLILHRICYRLEKYILYCSQNNEKALQFLEPISYEIKNNKRLKFIYPNIDITQVKDEDSGKDRQDCFDIGRDLRVQAFSFEKNARGFKFNNQRPTLIIFDDIDDDQKVINPVLREKDWQKISKQMIPGLDSEIGKFKAIGTIIHMDCMIKRLIDMEGGKIYQAYQVDEDNKIIPSSIIFPELFSIKKFQKYITDFGSNAAASEYLNNPIDDVTNLIKRKWLMSCYCEELSFTNNTTNYSDKVQGVDFAFSDRVSADKSVFAGIGVNDDCKDLISYVSKKGMSIIEQFDYIEYLTGVYDFRMNALEENSIRSMSKEIKRYKFPFTLFWTAGADKAAVEKDWKQNEFDEKRHTIGKTAMITRLATMFENNFNSINEGNGYTFRIPYKTPKDKEIAHTITEECCSFALQDGKLIETGVHPDGPIAIQLCNEELALHNDSDIEVAFTGDKSSDESDNYVDDEDNDILIY